LLKALAGSLRGATASGAIDGAETTGNAVAVFWRLSPPRFMARSSAPNSFADFLTSKMTNIVIVSLRYASSPFALFSIVHR
jgi:hypothetical protein